jgi:hypothetical protein
MQLSTYLVGAGDNCRELISLFPLAFYHGFENRGMVGTQVDEHMADAAL